MKVLVTGGAGFVGHHVVQHLLETTDWDVILLDRLDLSGNLNRLTDLDCWEANKARVTFVWHDLKAPISDTNARYIGKPDYVLHLAAGSHVDRSIDDPLSFVMDNVVGTCNLLNWARTNESLQHLIYFSTDEVFGPAPEGTNWREWDRYNSGNPYAASKAGAEELCVAFHNTYRLPISITHCMNIFGERQHAEKFIPSTIRKVIQGETVTIHSDKTRTKSGSRFYIHARQVAEAVRFILGMVPNGDKFNIVGEREVSNLEMAEMIAAALHKPLKHEMVDFHSSRPGHDLRYALDGNKLAEAGWTPKRSLEQTLAQTVTWFQRNPAWCGLTSDAEKTAGPTSRASISMPRLRLTA